jgi:hypothetical protein
VGIAAVSLIATRWLPGERAPSHRHMVVPETPPQEEVAPIVTP